MSARPATRVITYAEAVREALAQAMEADERVFLLGEDIGVYGGAFGVTGDLYDRFGAERVRDTPISELGIVGAAVGRRAGRDAAGRRDPVLRLHRQAMDQIVNQAAKIHFMLGGAASVPMVLRAPAGSGTGAAAQHSQSPGGVVRARPRAEGGACRRRRPTPRACCWPRSTTPTRSSCWSTSCSTARPGPVPSGADRVPLGEAAVRRTGAT